MRVLVTGAAGLIGRQVLVALRGYGVEAIALDAAFSGANTEGVRFVAGNILDRDMLSRVLEERRVDRVIHCAAVLQATCQERPELGVSVNVMGTVNVLEAARRANVGRVVLASSIAAYGKTRVTPMTEQHPCEPLGIYGTAKLLAEQIGEAFERTSGLECFALRYGLVYGPGYVRTKGVAADFQDILRSAVHQRIIRIPSTEQRFPFIYVMDAAEATVRACLATPAPAHRVFNVSSHGHTMEEVADILLRFYPDATVQRDSGGENSPINGDLDISLAQSELRFSPRVTLEEGLKETCAFFEEMESCL